MSVFSLFNKSGMIAQVLKRLVFNNQQAIWFKQALFKNNFWQIGDPVQVIRRVGKYQIILFGFNIQVFEYIFAVGFYLCKLMLPRGISKIINAMNTPVDRYNFRSAA